MVVMILFYVLLVFIKKIGLSTSFKTNLFECMYNVSKNSRSLLRLNYQNSSTEEDFKFKPPTAEYCSSKNTLENPHFIQLKSVLATFEEDKKPSFRICFYVLRLKLNTLIVYFLCNIKSMDTTFQ